MLLESLEGAGIPTDQLVDGLPLSLDDMRDKNARYDWGTFVAVHENLARIVGSTRALEEVGERLVHVPSYDFLRRIAAWVVSPRELNIVGMRWLAPSLFPHLRFRILALDDRQFVVESEIPEGYAPSIPFWHVCRGAVSAVPTLLGRPKTHIEAEITPRRSVLHIRFEPSFTMLDQLKTWIGVFRNARAVTDELVRQQADISESFQAMLRSRQDFRNALQQVPTCVAIMAEGRLLWANPAFARTLGYDSPHEVVGKDSISFVHTDDRAAVAERMASPVDPSGGRRVYRLLKRDGGSVVVETCPTVEVEFEGRKARLLVGIDVTEREHVQEQLLLADRMASLGTIAAGVAHEINNPLAYAHTNLEIVDALLERGGEGALPTIRDAVATAREGIERVRTIVAELKTFSRRDEETIGVVDVHAVLDSTLTLAGNEVRQRARLIREYGDVAKVSGNRARLGQVFLNLLLNAAEAIPQGEPNRNTLRVRTRAVGDRIVVEVSDSGAGIANEVRDRIFEPFFTTKTFGTGTGLGLAICHNIVTRLGGTIEVETHDVPELSSSRERPIRTTFRVTLQAGDEASVSQPPVSSSPPSRPKRRRLLVIDDEPELLRVLDTLLAPAHDVVMASGGEAALSVLARDDRFDLVLCDLMMAGRSGIDVFEAVRRDHPHLERRMIFMTGGAFTPRVRSFLKEVKNPCLEKPFDTQQLLDLVDRRSIYPS